MLRAYGDRINNLDKSTINDSKMCQETTNKLMKRLETKTNWFLRGKSIDFEMSEENI